jgi:hydroxymethylbilane synthase
VNKLRDSLFDAIIISRAGLARLALDVSPLLSFDLNPERWICAPGQGVIAVETRKDDVGVLKRLADLNHPMTMDCTRAERSLLVTYGGGCHAPFGAYARPAGDVFHISVAAPGRDGGFRVETFQGADLDQARSLASDWIRGGCPDRKGPSGEPWIARPARPWC